MKRFAHWLARLLVGAEAFDAIRIDGASLAVKRLRLEPGDIVVLSSKHSLSHDQIEILKRSLKMLLPGGQRAMVLQEGMRVDVHPSTSAEPAGLPPPPFPPLPPDVPFRKS